jgi:peroxiredoxin
MNHRAERPAAARWMALALAATVATGAAAGGAGGCARVVTVGAPFGAFALPDTTGDLHRSAVVLARAATVVLYLWSADCAASARADPAVADLFNRWRGRGVEFLAIDPHRGEEPARAAAAAGERDVLFPVLLDGRGRLAARLGARTYPAAALLDAAGVLRWRGPVEGLGAALEALAAGTPPAAAELPAGGCAAGR